MMIRALPRLARLFKVLYGSIGSLTIAMVVISAACAASKGPEQISRAPALATTLLPIPHYPLKASANGRYLVDQNNVPFLLVGDSPHALIGRLSLTAAGTYLSSRHAAGVNAMWVEMFCSNYSGICPGYTTYDGIAPFAWTNNDPNTFDLSAPNAAYFSRVDAMVNLAAQNGIVLFLDPTETGGWMTIFENNGATKAYNFGVFLGNRYKNYTNIVWQHGNDFQTWSNSTDDNLIRSVANGIKSVDTNHLQTVELDFPTSASLNDSTWAPIIGLDTAYSYFSPYDQVLREYNRSSYMPVDFLEGVYEYQGYSGGYSGPHELRAQEYWTQLSGSAGNFYGNANTYGFPSGWQNSNWQTSPGIRQLTYFRNLFQNRAWYNLVPDQNHTVVTAGYGTYQSITDQVMGNTSDYVTTAMTGDRTLAISYMPTVRTIAVDMSKLSGVVAGRWYDPTNGTYATVSGSPFANSGTKQFTPPGKNSSGDGDWVLVLEVDSGVPGVPGLKSTGGYDGWILESAIPGTGGGINSGATTLQLGDNLANRQYRSIFSFNTAALPDNAVVTKVTLSIKRQGLLGTNPFTSLGSLQVYIKQPSFGALALEKTDFEATPNPVGSVATIAEPSGAANGTWYTADLDPSAFPSVNLFGTTQLRLQFATGTNGNYAPDWMRFFSGNADTASRPLLSVQYTQTGAVISCNSGGANDGWILESAVPGTGGGINSGATTLQLGDNLANRQYRSILSFNTAALPDNAVVTKVTLRIKRQGLTGTNPFASLGSLGVYIKQPSFGALALEKTDFQATPNPVGSVATIAEPSGASNGTWYTADLDPNAFPSVNLFGTTQLRLQFATGTNGNNAADWMAFFSGNADTASRPLLVVQYH